MTTILEDTEIEEKKFNYDDIYETQDGLVFNPFNPINIEIKEEDVKRILKNYGLPELVNNMELYKRAFIHTSYLKKTEAENKLLNIVLAENINNCMTLKSKSNERLEYVGDGLLEKTVKEYLYMRFPKALPGFLTQKKIDIVKNETIGRIAYEMGLHKWFVISAKSEENNLRTNLKKLGCLFEAFIGALYLDMNKLKLISSNISCNDKNINKNEEKWFDLLFAKRGLGTQIVQQFIENVIELHINWTELIETDENYKNILQVKIQKNFKTTPTYIELSRDENGFEMGVFLCIREDIKNYSKAIRLINLNEMKNIIETENKILCLMGSGKHKIKRKAEQSASFNAIQIL